MRTVIIANGEPPSAGDIQRWLRQGDQLLCADGGARTALAHDFAPQAVIGDFDSLSENDLSELARLGAQLYRYPTHKDETDLELTLTYAIAAMNGAAEPAGEPSEIVILGALGGRLDQTIANVMLLAMPVLAGARTLIANGGELTFLVTPDQPADLRGAPGDVVSLIPFGGDAHGVRTDGLEYPLRDESLTFGPARGVSNVMLGDRACVTLREGRLLCVHSTR